MTNFANAAIAAIAATFLTLISIGAIITVPPAEAAVFDLPSAASELA